MSTLTARLRSRAEHPLIGARWKSSNVCSRGVLTDRGLDLIFQLVLILFVLLCSLEGFSSQIFLVLWAQWSHFDSIPNSIVKRCCGEDTWGVAPWDNSSVPGSSFQRLLCSLYQQRSLCFLYLYQEPSQEVIPNPNPAIDCILLSIQSQETQL